MRAPFPRISPRARRLVSTVALVLGVSPAVHADGALLAAHVECARASAPGRIVCDVHATASAGKLVWVDALVVQAPSFARPLRSRVVAQIVPAGSPAAASAKLALVASELGKGELELRVRGVVCSDAPSGEWCAPEVVRVVGVVEVGEAAPAALAAP
jgi:hypothetical protein